MPTPDQLAALRAAAEAATPGPWQVVTDEHPHCMGGKHIERRIFTSLEHPQLRDFSPVVTMSVGVPEVAGERAIQMVSIRHADADYIAAANPAAVQGLLADLDAMAQELLAYRADASLDTAGATIRAQAARIAELQRDAARWRYATQHGFPQCSRQIYPALGPREWHIGEYSPGELAHETPEAAIDAAIEQDHAETQGAAD